MPCTIMLFIYKCMCVCLCRIHTHTHTHTLSAIDKGAYKPCVKYAASLTYSVFFTILLLQTFI